MSGRRGSVHLVGAGPGDPGLLTRRGEELLRQADVILLDRLVDRAVLELAPPRAERIDVGKDPSSTPGGRAMPQEAINALLVDRARRGQLVVRLKGGDPFLFGRGSEELAACRAAGVPCEVVPGVSSALAGPAALEIPVTERGVARSVAIATGRGGSGLDGGVESSPTHDHLDVQALSRMDTVVMLMGRERLRSIVGALLAAGRSGQTPAAVVERATWPQQRSVRGTLATIGDLADEARIEPPALLVIGPTAGPDRSSRRSLQGRRMVVTRPRSASRLLVAELRARGAEVIECPLIRIEILDPPPECPDPRTFDWLVFTSMHGVRGFARSLEQSGLDARALAGLRIAAVGPRTASEVWERLRVRSDLVPSEHRAKGLVAALEEAVWDFEERPRILFACGTLAREMLPRELAARGMLVEELVVYRTLREIVDEPTRRALARARQDEIDAVLLYSPSAVQSLVWHAEEGVIDVDDTIFVCVGPTTLAAARAAGLAPIVAPEEYGDPGVLDLLERGFGRLVDPPVAGRQNPAGGSEGP